MATTGYQLTLWNDLGNDYQLSSAMTNPGNEWKL